MNFALAGVVARQHRSSASLGMQASEFRERGAENQAFFFFAKPPVLTSAGLKHLVFSPVEPWVELRLG